MTFLPDTERPLLKKTYANPKDYIVIRGNPRSSEIVDYQDGFVRGPILGLMESRYCRRVTKGTEKQGDDYPVYTVDPIGVAEASVRAGLFEVIPTGILSRIAQTTGNLSQMTEFDFVRDDKTDDEFMAAITQARDAAGFQKQLTRLEEVSVACGSAVLLIQILGGKLNYQVIPADRIWVCFADEVDGRPTDTMNIDEASVVVLKLSKESYVAYFGACDKYPQGRMVKYGAKNWFDIPAPDAAEARDHLDDAGAIANPLTVLRQTANRYDWPEYPVVPWYGTVAQVGETLLTSDPSLYESALEIDLANSRTLTAACKSATGMVVFSAETGASPIWSDNIGEGIAMLQPGQSVNILSMPAANVTALGDIVKLQMNYIADIYGIPAHLLGNVQAVIPSGAAMWQMNQPLQRRRDKRAEINRDGMDRIFQIELCLARIENDDASFADGIMQRWVVGTLDFAKSEQERIEETKGLKELSAISQRDIIRRHVPGMAEANDDEVDEYIESIQPAEPEAPAFGRGLF